MDDPYPIRVATSTDLPAIAAIERAVFSDPWSEAAFATELDGVALVAVHGAHVVGYAFARAVVDEAELRNLAVHPEHRRRSVGRRLLAAVTMALSTGGVRTVYLEVRASNRVARTFYRRLGFAEVGVRARYYRRPVEDAVLMARGVAVSEGA